MYNTTPPAAPTSTDPDDFQKYFSSVTTYLRNLFALGCVVTRLPDTSALDTMVSINDKGKEGRIFYVSNGTAGKWYKTYLSSGNLAYSEIP
jgi:hypothetical protein